MIQVSNKVIRAFVAVVGLVVIVYFGILIYKQLKPQTLEQKILHCLELGSDQRASACIKLLQDEPKRLCNFEISAIKEYFGKYGGRLSSYYKIYEGTIRNKSDQTEHLKAMIGKLYTNDKILIETGYTTIDEDIDSGVSLPFKINIQSSSEEDLNSLDSLTKDIYPWFTTCK
ncbi:MAG: hypothetical protein AAB386_02630 [Patescibacteria group bacterium]